MFRCLFLLTDQRLDPVDNAAELLNVPAYQSRLKELSNTAVNEVSNVLKSHGFHTAIVKAYTAADVIGQFVGTTAPKTQRLILSTLESVLFIDEAYAITDGGSPYSGEAIAQFVATLYDLAGLTSFFIAGYPRRTEKFIGHNEGFRRRFNGLFYLTPITGDAAYTILCDKLRGLKAPVPETAAFFKALYAERASAYKATRSKSFRGMARQYEKWLSERLFGNGIASIEKLAA